MRFLGTILTALTLLGAGATPGFAAALAESANTETHEIHYQIDGHAITTYVHLFRESPSQNPKLLEQVRAAGLDHVVFLDEEEDQARTPSALNELQQLHDDIQQNTDVPVVDIRQKKGFFKRLGALWDESFKDPARKPGKADFTYGLVSTVGDAAMTSIMVFSSSGIPLENGIAMIVAGSALAYVNNVWNNSINHFLSHSVQVRGKPSSSGTYLSRSLVYDFIQSQFLRLMQSGRMLLSWPVQSTILMNSLLTGVGDTNLNNGIYKAYSQDKVRLARANYYLNAISSTFASIDLMQHKLMPVLFNVGAYDVRLSAPILIAYYITAAVMLKKHPEKVYKIVDFIYNTLQKARNGLIDASRSCLNIFKNQSNDDEGPPESLASSNP